VFCVGQIHFNLQLRLLYVPSGLTDKNSTFCPHSVYLFVLCGSQNKQRLFDCTALNWLGFAKEAGCVYCAVRAESSNVL
jgi:hypothetical protein